MPRYVVQEHFTDPHHFDFMLERGGALATWSFPRPLEELPQGQTGPRLADHRLAYLEYEGEISGGRGRVRIHDRGDYEVAEWSDARVRVTLTGGLAAGTWALEPACGADEQGRPLWRIRLEPGSATTASSA